MPSRHEARLRHAAYFAQIAREANELYEQGNEAALRGLKLFDVEWRNIEGGQAWSATEAVNDNEAARLCNEYPRGAGYCLHLRVHPRKIIEWLQAALGAARRLQERGSEGVLLGNLGMTYLDLGETDRAIDLLRQELKIVEEFRDVKALATTLGNLGSAYLRLGEVRRAIEFLEQQLAISREIGDRRGEAVSLGNL